MQYTTFKLSHAGPPPPQSSFDVKSSDWSREYGITVTNVGTVAGDEVVQAFFQPPATPSSGGLPLIKQLFGYERVSLAPCAPAKTTSSLPRVELRLLHPNGGPLRG